MQPPVTPPTARDVLAGVDLADRTVVITGATAGMGLASAHALASAGARVIMLGRQAEVLEQRVAQVGSGASGPAPIGVQMDLVSLASVAAAAEQVTSLAPAIDVLMNNAGVMFTPFGRTTDGFETQFGVCHLGHFALTEALVPALAAAAEKRGEARLVVLASAGHKMSDIDLEDPNWESRGYDKFAAYGAAKTANVLHAVGFAAHHGGTGITAVSVHPGTVATELARHMTREDFSTMFSHGSGERPQTRARVATPEEGASTQVWAAVAPELRGHAGAYLADRTISTEVMAYAVDPERAARLWELSREATAR